MTAALLSREDEDACDRNLRKNARPLVRMTRRATDVGLVGANGG
jgi:hypothetical protein